MKNNIIKHGVGSLMLWGRVWETAQGWSQLCGNSRRKPVPVCRNVRPRPVRGSPSKRTTLLKHNAKATLECLKTLLKLPQSDRILCKTIYYPIVSIWSARGWASLPKKKKKRMDNTSGSRCSKLTETYPRRAAAVITAKGGTCCNTTDCGETFKLIQDSQTRDRMALCCMLRWAKTGPEWEKQNLQRCDPWEGIGTGVKIIFHKEFHLELDPGRNLCMRLVTAVLVTDQPLVEPVHVVVLQTPSKLIGQLARLDVAGELISRDQDHLRTQTSAQTQHPCDKWIQRIWYGFAH